MFIGHFAVALAAKKAAPKTSLGTLILSAQFLDLLWPPLLLLGVEHVRISPGNTATTPFDFYDYPISHSMVTSLGWSLFIGCLYFGLRRDIRGAAISALLVFSHWILDFVTHRPDLPLSPGSAVFMGLGLWNSFPATVGIETAMFVASVFLYTRATRAKDKAGMWTFWSFIGCLGIIDIANMFGPPPTDVQQVAIASLSLWLLVPWGNWIDQHREAL